MCKTESIVLLNMKIDSLSNYIILYLDLMPHSTIDCANHKKQTAGHFASVLILLHAGHHIVTDWPWPALRSLLWNTANCACMKGMNELVLRCQVNSCSEDLMSRIDDIEDVPFQHIIEYEKEESLDPR